MLDKAKNRGEPTPYLRNINVRWNGFALDDIAQMPMSREERTSLAIQDGDIMVCEGGEPGRAAVWAGGPTNLAFQKALMRVRPMSGVEPRLITSYLRHAQADGALEPYLTGTTIKHLPQAALSRILLPLPPLPEQRRIVAKIDSLSAKSRRARDHLEDIHRLVEKYKQAILAAAFRGKLTWGWRETHGIEHHWRSRLIGDLVSGIVAGKNLRCEERPPSPAEKGVVKVSAVTWGEFDPLAAKTLPKDFAPSERTRIIDGDFLISRANTLELVGAVVVVDKAPGNLFLSDKILRMEMQEDHKPWLLWFLRSLNGRNAIENSATGNQLSMRNLSQDALCKIVVPWPDARERAYVVRRIETAFAWIDRLAAEAASARTLIDRLDQAVLAKAFRGELVPQDPADEPADALLARIRAARRAEPGRGRRRRERPD